MPGMGTDFRVLGVRVVGTNGLDPGTKIQYTCNITRVLEDPGTKISHTKYILLMY